MCLLSFSLLWANKISTVLLQEQNRRMIAMFNEQLSSLNDTKDKHKQFSDVYNNFKE